MSTLLLDTVLWDLCADASGNIAVAAPPYALAQDVASAVRLFLGELWYDTSQGVPYFQQILGRFPPLGVIKSNIVQAALTVPGVVTATCIVTGVTGRVMTGQVQFTDSSGTTDSVGF